jgi:hypothetical protein
MPRRIDHDHPVAEPSPAPSAADEASDSSSEEDVTLLSVKPPAKKAKLQHGVKNKSAKKTTVSDSRPRTAAARDALKKPGTTPPIFAYLNLPVGRPPKKTASSNDSTTVAESTVAESSDAKPASLPQKKTRTPRGSYQSFEGGEFQAAKRHWKSMGLRSKFIK